MIKLFKKLIIFLFIAMTMSVIALIVFGPQWYLESENNNFRKMRAEQRIDCKAMPLHCAVKNDSIQKFNNLITNGADIETKNKSGQSALYWTVIGTEIISVDSPGRRMDPIKRDKFITKLLDAGANVKTKNFRGRTLLHAAISRDLETIKKLVEAGADVNERSNASFHYLGEKQKKERWVYPLYVAVENNNVDKVKYLAIMGADINSQSTSGSGVLETALHASVNRNNVVMAELLLKLGANPNIEGSFSGKSIGTPLAISQRRNFTDMTKLLSAAIANQ